MYGMVNKGVKDLVEAKGGIVLWEKVRATARCPFSTFQQLEAYDDEVTYQLVGAVSKELNLTPAAVLEAFGEYWIEFTATEGYGPVLSLFGATFMESILNLNILHERIGSMFPKLRPPRFEFKNKTPTSVELHYFSTREGLAPMMLGLIKGLAKRSKTEVSIEHTPKSAETDHDIFQICLR
jgi:Haem-NO-binding